jgi:two-component system, chemotaxis family, protein-glutamate methylesterase/glutaminase
MRALPFRLDGSQDQPAGIACPECPGTLKVRLEGDKGHLRLECRIGHVFSLHELILAAERNAEDSVWAAILRFEELAALLHDASEHAEQNGWPGGDLAGERRSRSASDVAAALRALLELDRPMTFDAISSPLARSDGE